jgi:hypothetical protein
VLESIEGEKADCRLEGVACDERGAADIVLTAKWRKGLL